MSYVSTQTRVFDYLQSKFVFPIGKQELARDLKDLKNRIYEFVRTLPLVFGGHNIAQISRNLEKSLADELNVMDFVYKEILGNLRKGTPIYSIEDFPWTSHLMDKHRSFSQSDSAFLLPLQEGAYSYLPFLQQARCFDHYNQTFIDSLQKTREKGISILKQLLIVPNASLSKGDKSDLARLMFTGGAFIRNRETVYFSEAFKMWASLNKTHTAKAEQIFARMEAADWVGKKITPDEEPFEFQIPFFKALIIPTLEEAEEVLRFQFLPLTRKLLIDYCETEGVRSDLVFFNSYLSVLNNIWDFDSSPSDKIMQSLERVMELNWVSCKESKKLLLSIQVYLHLTRVLYVPQHLRATLFEMVLHRAADWDINQMIGWTGSDKWRGCGISGSDPMFQYAIENLWNLSDGLTKGKKNDDIWVDPFCFPLVYFFLSRKDSCFFVKTLKSLSDHPNMTITPRIAYLFCKKNEGYGLIFKQFEDAYLILLELLREDQAAFTNGERVFLDPPLSLVTDSQVIQMSKKRAQEFLRFISGTGFSLNDSTIYILREYLFHPTPYLYELLIDIVGKKSVTEAHFAEICSIRDKEDFDRQINPNDVQRARRVTLSLGNKYKFDGAPAISLFFEILKLHIGKQESILREISCSISELNNFCGHLSKEQIYYLFRYHPKIHLTQIYYLKELRQKIIDSNLNRFILDQELVQSILDYVQKISGEWGEADIDKGPQFAATMVNVLLASFFPSLQPLADYLKISGLSAEEGAKWISSALVSHLGQYLSIYGSHPTSIYFNWLLVEARPVLFMTFSNFEKGSAISKFVSLDLPLGKLFEAPRRHSLDVDSLEGKDSRSIPDKASYGNRLLPPEPTNSSADLKRQDIFTYLYSMLPAFKEKTDETPSVLLNSSERPDNSVNLFTGLADNLSHYEERISKEREAIWKFAYEVKTGYRKCLLSQSTDKFPNVDPYMPSIQVASQGCIYPIGRGALLPSSLMDVEGSPKFYTPDANTQDILSFRLLFSNRTSSLSLLKFKLAMSDNEGREVEFPVFYTAQKLTELLSSPIEAKQKWDERARRLSVVEGGMYVTLQSTYDKTPVRVPLHYSKEALSDPNLFQKFFDFQNLVLKGSLYYAMVAAGLERPQLALPARQVEEKKVEN